MIRVVSFDMDGALYPLFIDDTTTGYDGKDLLSQPGAYGEVASEALSFPIAELSGNIDGYASKMMGLLAFVNQDADGAKYVELADYTDAVKRFLTVPGTAAKILLQRETEEMREFYSTALDVIHFYESVTPSTKVFLPQDAFQFVDEDTAKSMRSTRHVYALKGVDNQEILQKSCTDEYGIILDSLEDIHGGTADVSSLDLLRVLAPYREELPHGRYRYHGIYHTPYYKVGVDKQIVPEWLSWLSGSARNDTLPIQANEYHMYDNLVMLVCSDTAAYVDEICTGLFLATAFGQKLKKLISCQNTELLAEISTEITSACPPEIVCGLNYSEIQLAVQNATGANDMVAALARLVSDKVKVSTDYVLKLIETTPPTGKAVETEHLPFVLSFDDEAKEELTRCLIDHHIISHAIMVYIIDLCCRAYTVNWGHSGAVKAIPGFITKSEIDIMNNVLGVFLGNRLSNGAIPKGMDFHLLYSGAVKVDEDGGLLVDDSTTEQEDIFSDFDYYITPETMQLIKNDMLPLNYFRAGSVSGVETTEANIIEYWRRVNGEQNLRFFISSAFTTIGELEVLLQCFYRLMRWGSVKPALLVLPDYPQMQTVFDLNLGKEIPNTAVVDESKLVLVNGCRNSIAGFVTSDGIVPGEDAIVGLLLARDYGVQKYYLTSWVAVGEQISRGTVDIAELKAMSTLDLNSDTVSPITSFNDSGFEMLASDENIEVGLKLNISPTSLSELTLLTTPGVLRSAEYLRSKQNTMLVTTRDRQYQILSKYVEVIRQLYKELGSELHGTGITTTQLSLIARRAYELFNVPDANAAQDVNTVRAGNALNQLNLEGDEPSGVRWDTTPLEGKFTLVLDASNASPLSGIEFTDPQVKAVAAKAKNRVIMLLLETDSSLILCRKDISAKEVLIRNSKIACRHFADYASRIEAIKNGSTATAKAGDGSTMKPVLLHSSLNGII